jgi:hypothetical protein
MPFGLACEFGWGGLLDEMRAILAVLHGPERIAISSAAA